MHVTAPKNLSKSLVVFLLIILLTPTNLRAAEFVSLSNQDRSFLEKVEKDSFAYFQKYAHPKTGLILDSSAPGAPSSIAATGFALAAYGIAQKHGWIGYREAYQIVGKIFDTLQTKASHKNGFYFHFLDPATGKRTWSSEASSIDTALLIAGALLAGEYFKGTDVEKQAEKLYRSINWPWMLNGSFVFSHGWKPNSGFLPYYWDMYSEHLILLALAMGSPTFPAPKQTWDQWVRFEDEYNQRKIVYSFTGSLFTYQYAQAFIDFRELSDRGINYFENSTQATLANREFCIANKNRYPSYSDLWGLSASLGPDGYQAYGAQPGVARHDGTVAPYAMISSLVFTPAESLEVIHFIDGRYREKIYGDYGFKSAFNVDQNWWADEYLGIDEGIVVLMLENFLNEGEVWNQFMKLPAMARWIEKAELKQKTPTSY